jgi:glycosyl hydrolase family 25
VTVFGWDASHYDAPPTARDGVDFYTHKVTEGDGYFLDTEYRSAITAARDLGIPILGSYHVQHGGRTVSYVTQAAWWVKTVDQLTPWWRSHPCWTWQIDAEKFDYMTPPTIDDVNHLGDEVVRLTGCPPARVLAYAPPWFYGAALTGLRYRLWSSNYGTDAAGAYRIIYPGDTSPRWHAPVEPLILQYSSQATIAGQSTCDANAYRGTLDELLHALEADTVTTLDDVFVDPTGRRVSYASAIRDTLLIAARTETAVTGLAAAVAALSTGQGNPDVAAILAGVDERLAALQTRIDAGTRDAVADLGEGGAAQVRGN